MGGEAELLAFGGDEVQAVDEGGGIDKESCDHAVWLGRAGREADIIMGVDSRLLVGLSMLTLFIGADVGVSSI